MGLETAVDYRSLENMV